MRTSDSPNEKFLKIIKMVKNVRENFSNLWKLFPRVKDIKLQNY
jgi:hypothetical protein